MERRGVNCLARTQKFHHLILRSWRGNRRGARVVYRLKEVKEWVQNNLRGLWANWDKRKENLGRGNRVNSSRANCERQNISVGQDKEA